MEHPSDEELLEAYQAGQEQAFTDLVKRYEKEVYHFLMKFLGRSSLAEEAFQESFLQVYLSVDRFETTRRFRPWLYTIAINKARDLLRSRARRPSVQLTVADENGSESDLWAHLLRDETTPDGILEEKQEKELVRQVVGQMPDHLREILILAYLEQLSYKEMAEVLNIPLGTVKSRLHAAVKAFSHRYQSAAEPIP